MIRHRIVTEGSNACYLIEGAMLNGWCSRGELAAMVEENCGFGRSSAYRVINTYSASRLAVTRVSIGRKMWMTLKPDLPWTEEMVAEYAWSKLTKDQKRKLTADGIGSVPDKDEYHTKLLAALTAMGDEAAEKALKEILCKSKLETKRTPPVGLANVLDVFTLGYKKAAQLTAANG